MGDELPDNPPGVSVRLADPDEVFFLDLWAKSFEASVARANESLARLVTLATAMAGGALVLLKEDVCYGWWRVAAAGCFFLALAAAAVGAAPLSADMPFSPGGVRDRLAWAARVKGRWVAAATALLVAGLAAALAGVVARNA